MTDRVKEILSYYRSDNPGTLTNIARLLNHGRLAGTGKLVVLPVDQGFEHGPGRSFAPNPAGYDPRYHVELALEAGCNAYAAPLGSIEAVAADYAGDIPLILKVNSHDVLHDEENPLGAQTSGVEDALRLGCVAIGYTIYPGTLERRLLYEQLRQLTLEAKQAGLAVVVWSYARGGDLKKEDETALDVIAYSAQIAAQLGAHLIKVKLPTEVLSGIPKAKDAYEKYAIPNDTLTDRVKHVVRSSFDGRRIVIFSGGPMNTDEDILNEARAIRDGGGFGSIMGRNAFQRDRKAAVELLGSIMKIYAGEMD